MSGGGDYLRERRAELRSKRGEGAALADPAPLKSGLDLSQLKPTPAVAPPPELEAAVIEEARGRGFDRSVGPAPASLAPVPAQPAATPRARPKRKAGGGEGAGTSARYVVSMKERPPADIPGQALFTGNAQLLYEICRRAHYERRPRGELLADMFAMYEAAKGRTPDEY